MSDRGPYRRKEIPEPGDDTDSREAQESIQAAETLTVQLARRIADAVLETAGCDRSSDNRIDPPTGAVLKTLDTWAREKP